MQVFELFFNPKLKDDLIFETFCYKPENAYERRLGSLFVFGELKSALSQNNLFVKNLSRLIKTEFYSLKEKESHRALKFSLKKANNFLSEIAKKGDVSWISNLNFAILVFNPIFSIKNKRIGRYRLNFTKTGDLRVLLARGNKVLGIDKDFETKEIEPYPLKIFLNILSGKLEPGDKILVFSKDVFDFFTEKNFIEEIAETPILDERALNGILKIKKREVSGFSGACLIISLGGEKEDKKLVFKENAPEIISRFLPKIKLPSFPFLTHFKGILLKQKEKLQKFSPGLKARNLILVISLILLLLLGSKLAGIEERRKNAAIEKSLTTIQEKIDRANQFLALKDEKGANSLLIETLKELQAITTVNNDLSEKVLLLEEDVTERLFEINKIESVEKPEILFELPKDSLFQRIFLFENDFYFFNSNSSIIVRVGQKKEISEFSLETQTGPSGAVAFNGGVLFFIKPDKLILFENDRIEKTTSLELPENVDLQKFTSYNNHLYFLDKGQNQIVKYSYLGNFEWSKPRSWLPERISDIKSMTIDGGIWLLKENNVVDYYFASQLKTSFLPEIFPQTKNFTKIFSSSSLNYLYLSEPEQKRIVIIDKNGKTFKQFKSEEFNNLKDFAVSENEKEIYLLNGYKLYKVSL